MQRITPDISVCAEMTITGGGLLWVCSCSSTPMPSSSGISRSSSTTSKAFAAMAASASTPLVAMLGSG